MKEFSTTVDNLSSQLTGNIKTQLERDMDNLELNVIDSLSPLKNFYTTERQKLNDSRTKLGEIKTSLKSLKQDMDADKS